MLAVSGVTSGIEIAAGLESFERSFDMLKPELTVHTDNQLRCLVQNLRDPLKYSEDTNARLAIHTFEANLLGDSEEVGNCVLVAALFACLRMRAGNLAGEAHYIQNLRHSQDFHSTAFLPDFNRIFDVVALSPAQISMPTVEQYNRYVISSIFSFVMALAMSKARSEMEELALATPIGAKVEPSRFEPYARMLAIAEAINPFLSSLYSRKAVLYAGTDAFRDTIELGDAVGKLRGEAIHFL
jgi:hypothetical protein